MSPEKLHAFTDALGKAQGGILRIIPAGSGEDIFPLEKQLCGAAQEKGWATACPTSRNAEWGDADVEGFECYARDWTAKDAVAFKEAMKAADLSCKYFPHAYDFDGITPLVTGGGVQNGVTTLIGRHPQS